MRNARVLSAENGETLALRLRAYVDPEDATRAAEGAGVAAIALDDPGAGASELAAAFRLEGAPVWVSGSRLVVVAARAVLERVASRVAGDARPIAAELVRAFDADRRPHLRLRVRELELDLGERARVMGILNVTPNSFYDGGRYRGVDAARERAAQMVALGADLIDIGGQSYSSTNEPVPAEVEAERVVPVVRALVRDGLGVPLSIDTFRATVARAALAEGAHLINDCSGLSDPDLAGVVARHDAALVVMHLRGRLNVRDAEYPYGDAMSEILGYLRERVERARAAGVAEDALAVDPGLEFGKEPATDLEILRRFGDLRSLGYPIVLAASRKRFIGRLFDRPASDLLVPSLAVAAAGIAAGARIVRAHDIAETLDLARMLAAVRGQESPARAVENRA